MKPCEHQTPLPGCRVCELACTREDYARLYREPWPAPTTCESAFPVPPAAPTRRRNLPCLYLGEVLDRLGCPCPGRWLRACAIHSACTIEVCKSCPDYDPE